jgi:hypothetical protein
MTPKKPKAFFYRLNAADFLAEIFQIPEGHHKEWLSKLALDLVLGEGSTVYSQKLIREVEIFREKMSKAGKQGMNSRYNNKNKYLQEVT